MDEKVIVAFAKWMQTKDQQLAQVPTEQLAQQVIKALQTEEGQKQLQPLFQQFQTEMQGGMFKRGGKMDQAVKKMSTNVKKGDDGLKITTNREVGEHRPTITTFNTPKGEIDMVVKTPVFTENDGIYQYEDRRGNVYDQMGNLVVPASNTNPYAQSAQTRMVDGNTTSTLFVSPDGQDSTFVAVRNGRLGPEINMSRSTLEDRNYIEKTKRLRNTKYVPNFIANIREWFGPDMSNFNKMRENHSKAKSLVEKE